MIATEGTGTEPSTTGSEPLILATEPSTQQGIQVQLTLPIHPSNGHRNAVGWLKGA